MKKKLFSLLLIAVMVLSSFSAVFAQTEATGQGGTGTMTVTNASNGEKYAIYKLFDAEMSTNYVAGNPETGSIIYKGTIPSELADVFETVNGSVVLKDGKTALTEADIAKIKAYVDKDSVTPIKKVTSTGGELTFTELKYGYYVVTSTQGTAAISIDSVNPDGSVTDKNFTKPGIVKSINDNDVFIGQTVTYTLKSNTANYMEGNRKVQSYVIEDTLPSFLKDVTVTSITVGGQAIATQQFADKEGYDNKVIVIPWVDGNGNHLYANGAEIVVTYTAEVTAAAELGGTINEDKTGEDKKAYTNRSGNINKVTLHPCGDNDGDEPFEEEFEDEAKFYSYAAALQKVDENKAPLAGAKFKFVGLEATGSNGVYTVTSYDPTATALGTTEFECDADGHLIILGLDSTTIVGAKTLGDARTIAGQETVAPQGYNLLNPNTVTITATKTAEKIEKTARKVKYDSNGKIVSDETLTETMEAYNDEINTTTIVVVNNKGTELPTTGGMGTTIIYILGAALVIGAGVVLVSRKKVNDR